jgi:sulfide:quinone oxidoreductase
VVILGGGFAGLTLAVELDALAASGQADVALVERNPAFQMGFAMEWLLAGRRGPNDGARPYSEWKARHVRFIQDEVATIDAAGRVVHTRSARLPYDHLVVALGAELAPELVPGLAEAGYNLCDMNSIQQLTAALRRLDSGTVLIDVASLPFKCPPAPYEYAFLIEDALQRRKVRDRIRLVLATPEAQPMPVAGPIVGDAIKALLADRGIEFLPGRKLKAVDPGTRIASFDDGSELAYDVLAAMPPHRAPKVLRDAGLTDSSGFVPAKLGTFETAVQDIYAVGDVASLKLPSGNPHPKAGVFAEAQALTVARSIAAKIDHRTPSDYTGNGVCYIDVGRDEAATAEASLLESTGPKVVLHPPSRSGLDDKVRFERERLRRWFT